MFTILQTNNNIDRWINNRNFKVVCNKCGMTLWRSSYKLHLSGKHHHIRINEKNKKISNIVYFN